MRVGDSGSAIDVVRILPMQVMVARSAGSIIAFLPALSEGRDEGQENRIGGLLLHLIEGRIQSRKARAR
jgi:hypothetical protein